MAQTTVARLWRRTLPRLSAVRCRMLEAQPPSSSRLLSSSVNPDEVSHFSALADNWWDVHGSSRLLHLMNPLRHEFIRASLATGATDTPLLSYLDIGCGGGIFAESAARLPTTHRVTAIDPTPSVLAVARAHARKDPSLRGKLLYRRSSLEELELPRDDDERHDVVTLFEVLEHVNQPAAVLERVKSFVKPGGLLVISTIARTWTSWLTTKFFAEDVLHIVPRGTHDWTKYINEEELRRHVLVRGWENPRALGVVYLPGFGWRAVRGSERAGNYFFSVRRGS